MEMDKSDLWDDPVYAGKVSKEHGALMGKIKEVNGFERELLEHIDMLKLAREENDNAVALVSTFLDGMYRIYLKPYLLFNLCYDYKLL